MFKVGDKIFYPFHGAGVIESIEEKEILGEKRKYYIVRLVIEEMKVMIPIDCVDSLGVRYVISKEECEEVFAILSEKTTHIHKKWNARYRENEMKIRGGNCFELAEVVRNLTKANRTKKLSSGENKIYLNARQILLSEIVLAFSINKQSADKLIEDLIK